MIEALIQKLPVEVQVTDRYKAEQLLEQLGFLEAEFSFCVNDLSGGQQNRLMFARAMINDPNLILFDEPTNHLDLRTLLLFEQILKGLRAAYLIISHDREFMDSVTNRTIFLRDHRLYQFDRPFSAAKRALQEQDVAAQHAREIEEKNIKPLQASAKRIGIWGREHDNEKLARKAKSMERRVDKMKAEQTFVSQGSGLKLSIDVSTARADRMLSIENKSIFAPDRSALFQIEDFTIRPGDSVALLGHNGVGKTTLINHIMNQFETNRDGSDVKFNPQCSIGYYDQELQLLNPKHSLVEVLRHHCGGADANLQSALIHSGFPHKDLDKLVKVLSGGERARLMFLIIKLNQPNFLILDEPTNHIDIQGKEELEEQILDSNATVLITSHDRRFVDNITTRYLLIANGALRELDDPAEFYAMRPRAAKNSRVPDVVITPRTASPDVLERIIELEELLQADLARKPKFQKLKMQAAWQRELDELNEKL